MKCISINKALFIGHLWVTIPTILSLLVGVMALLGIIFYFSLDKIFFVIGMIIPFGLAVLTFSVFVVRWKIWALKRVYDVNELLMYGHTHGLFYPLDSRVVKTEIKSKSQKLQLKKLYEKFNEPSKISNWADWKK